MKTATHSVAPWRVEPARGTLCAWRIESSGTNNAVAFVAQTIGNNQIENANAKLIASAPELLEACKAAEFAIRREKELQSERGESVAVDLGFAHSKILAAITKAEGNA